MAKGDSRRATPRTVQQPKKTSKSPQKASPSLAAPSKKRGATRVVLANPSKPRERTGAGVSPAKLFRLLARIAIIAAVVALLGAISLNIMRMLPVFTITAIDTEATEHLTENDIANLAGVAEGTTLLNVDDAVIEQNLMRNPWVKDVEIHREYPSKLKIVVHERQVRTLVLMSTSAFAWYIGEGNVWLEPATLDLSDGKTAKDAAQEIAVERGALFITDVPATVNPMAGSEVSDEVLLAIDTYLDELPEEITSQVVYFSASSLESISCVLSSGVEVSLGAPVQIEQKAAVLMQILEQYPGEITYINVRVPSSPSYRRIDSGTVQPGSGA